MPIIEQMHAILEHGKEPQRRNPRPDEPSPDAGKRTLPGLARCSSRLAIIESAMIQTLIWKPRTARKKSHRSLSA